LRSLEPRPSKSAPARHSSPRLHTEGFVSSEARPLPRSIAGCGQPVSDRRSPPSVRPVLRHPTLALCLAPASDRLAGCPNPVQRGGRPLAWWLQEHRPKSAQQRASQVSCAAAVFAPADNGCGMAFVPHRAGRRPGDRLQCKPSPHPSDDRRPRRAVCSVGSAPGAPSPRRSRPRRGIALRWRC